MILHAPGKPLLFWVWVWFLLLGGLSRAEAQRHRYALVVGANVGDAADARLQYAVSDARKMARVLNAYGRFPEENVLTLANPTANRFTSALRRLQQRLSAEASADDALLLVFYSGHADALSMHLGGTKLRWETLQQMVKRTPAGLRLLILDACRSGSATRVKGARLAKPFMATKTPQGPSGMAILSSATAGEDAQESESLKASFFTHHFVSALRGVADRNRDGKVTLEEAYRYTADRTVASTASTLAGIQHPTYKFDLKGKSDIVLTHTRRYGNGAAVALVRSGQYLFHRGGAEGPIVAEAHVQGGNPRELRLPAGRYFVRVRLPRRLYEGRFVVRAATSNTLRFGELRPVAYAQLVRKGSTPRGAYSLSLWGGYSMPMLEYQGMPTGALVFAWDGSVLTIDSELRFAYGWNRSAEIDASLFETDLLVGVRKVFDVGPFAFSLGVKAGAGVVHQRFETERIAPSRTRWIPLLSSLVRGEYQLPEGFFVGAEGDLNVSYLRATDGLGNETEETPVRFSGRVGLGRYW